MKKTASALVLAGSLAFVGVGTANAVDSYPAPAPATVSDAFVVPGSTVAFGGSGFTPGETVRVTVTYSNDPVVVPGTGVNGVIVLAQQVNSFDAVAAADGTFSTQVALGEAGTYTLTATGLTSGRVVASAVVVDPAAANEGTGPGTGTDSGTGAGAGDSADDGDLADTGADSAMLLWGAAGVLALGAGVASVVVARRKNA